MKFLHLSFTWIQHWTRWKCESCYRRPLLGKTEWVFFFKVFVKSEIVYWNRLQLLSFSFCVWTFLKSEQMMRQRHTGTFRVFTKMHTVKKDVICYTHVSSILLGWSILRVRNHLLPLIELIFLLKASIESFQANCNYPGFTQYGADW